jgi:hypothetical protein
MERKASVSIEFNKNIGIHTLLMSCTKIMRSTLRFKNRLIRSDVCKFGLEDKIECCSSHLYLLSLALGVWIVVFQRVHSI